MRVPRTVAAASAALLVAACTAAAPATPPPTATPTVAPTAAPSPSASHPETAWNLPAEEDIVQAGAKTIRTTNGSADWLVIAGGYLWAAGIENGLGRFDLATGALVDTIPAPDQCAAMDVGFGSVWTEGCDFAHARVTRFDEKTGKATYIELPKAVDESESSIGVGEGAVWLIVGTNTQRELVKIDPATNQVAATYPIPGAPVAVRAGGGAVWVADPYANVVHRVDPATGKVVATIKTGGVPRFIAFGAGALWTMNQADGNVSRIDPATNTVAATIDIGERVDGGDIAVGGGFVWLRGNPTLVLKIDPATNTVVAVYGPSSGSGSIAADDAAVWVSAHDIDTLWRLPLP